MKRFHKFMFFMMSFSMLINAAMFVWNKTAEADHEKSVKQFNAEFSGGYQLLYGEWEMTEFLGGGMPQYYSEEGIHYLGCGHVEDYYELPNDRRKKLTVHPDYLAVDDEEAYGEVTILYKIIPDNFLASYLFPVPVIDNPEVKLKSAGQDFYLIADITSENEEIRELTYLLPASNMIFVKDVNTMIMSGGDGFFKWERIGSLSEEEISIIMKSHEESEQRHAALCLGPEVCR